MYRKTHSIATAHTGRTVDCGIYSGLPELMQRTWSGQVSDETVKKWMKASGLLHAAVAVYKNFDRQTFMASRRDIGL